MANLLLRKSRESVSYDEQCEVMLIQLYERVRYVRYGEKLNFTPSERTSLRLSWNAWIGGNPSQRGFQMFLRMFKSHPETQLAFEFAKGSSLAYLQNSSRLLFHVNRVVKYIGKVIENLDSPEEVVPVLLQLGAMHGPRRFNVPSGYFPHLGVAMRELMRESLGNWTEDLNKLWDELYQWIIQRLIEGQQRVES
ncbi:uncharacterized protein LOC106153897 [Lingula anatina]|uniref:Uncharacterized protein LOC106153897 n=1 Tax=Lingula anatina TaxID=7574 RepID=A0A1S3HBT1_LINAN|nr:uncharacterized protein LOC106153897 [Lingula anatina]|eukprot:XP_013383487.1 uncharacterized protein LOC106153897 [Lingula anatina]